MIAPHDYVEEIINTTLMALQHSVRTRVRVFVNASSSSVYGNSGKIPSKESGRKGLPLSIYGALKKSSELLCHSYHASHGMTIVNARLFSVYGPRGRPDQIVYKMTQMVEEGKTIANVQPDPLRDFTYITDIVSGLERIPSMIPDGYHVLNLGSGLPYTMTHLRKIVERVVGKKAVIGQIKPLAPFEAKCTYADTNLAKQSLDWEAKISLEQGVECFVSWYRART